MVLWHHSGGIRLDRRRAPGCARRWPQRAFHIVYKAIVLNNATVHPVWVRMFHWINAAAVILMYMSGWLGGALLWHFAVMWILVANFVAYLVLGTVTGRLRRTMFPLTIRAVATDLVAALHPQTLLTLTYDGQTLPAKYGFPMKLRMPNKLGYKNPKHIVAITVTNAFPGGFWENQGYNWFGGS
jgi:hypothetical protein